MKKILLLLMFTAVSQAQIVNIPDANFKAKLLSSTGSNNIVRDLNNVSIVLDANNDGEIQVSEALNVGQISVVNSSIASLQGVEDFSNLVYLFSKNNNLTTLDVSGLANLLVLDVSGNQLNSLVFTGCPALREIKASNNQLTSLDLSEIESSFNSGANCDVSHNLLTTLTVGNSTYFYKIDCSYNQLTTLDISNVQMGDLYASHNNLVSLNLPISMIVNYFDVSNNLLTSLDLSAVILYLGSDVNASYNNLTSINLTGVSKNLTTLELSNNMLETLDVSSFTNNSEVDLDNNPALHYIFAKNGKLEYFHLNGDNGLQFICADEEDFQSIESNLNNANLQDVVVGPYCFFTPGGNYNTINGNIIFDADSNGCDSNDPYKPYVKLNLINGNNNYSVFTLPDGTYSNFGQMGTFNVSVAMENASLFTITPPLATIMFGNNNNNITTQDFCIIANGIQNDLETVIVPLAPARPGFDATYEIVYKNKGNQMLSGNVDFTYQENELDFLNASIIPDAQSSGALSWNFSNLYPFESRSIEVRLNVNSPMETPAVNIGDQLSFSVQANPLSGDVTPDDNAFSIKQIVVGSFDPNDITCLEGEHVNPTEIGNYLHYNINFENTRTAAAENIVVKDMIDLSKYDISSLQILNASHPMTPRITNDKVEFIFEGINLGASEHGNVTFKIKTKNTLVTGNSVSQKADIYFDYNFPVATNVAVTTFDTLGTGNPVSENEISFYPNPVSDILNVKSVENIRKIDLYDLRGRLLQTVSEINTINLTEIPSGIYLVQVFTDTGSKSSKIIKK